MSSPEEIPKLPAPNLRPPIIRSVSERLEILGVLRSGKNSARTSNPRDENVPLAVIPAPSNTSNPSVVFLQPKPIDNEQRPCPPTATHPPEVISKERSRIRNPLNDEQKEKARQFMEAFGWKELRTKIARDDAKKFCTENGIEANQFKNWLEYSRKVRRSKGLPTK